MKAKLLIRIAAVLILIHMLGHGFGHFTWQNTDNPVKQEVIKQMFSHEFHFMGTMRSMGDYYRGYSLLLLPVYAMSIVLLWLIANASDTQRRLCRQLLYPIAGAYLFFGAIELTYFFPFAAAMSLGAGLLCVGAILLLNKWNH
jgi:hypothetical protein